MLLQREQHRTATVDEDLAPKVGLLFELLHIEAIGATVEAIVDVAGRLARIVLTIVGEFGREPMEGASVSPRDEPFDHLAGVEVESTIASYGIKVQVRVLC